MLTKNRSAWTGILTENSGVNSGRKQIFVMRQVRESTMIKFLWRNIDNDQELELSVNDL